MLDNVYEVNVKMMSEVLVIGDYARFTLIVIHSFIGQGVIADLGINNTNIFKYSREEKEKIIITKEITLIRLDKDLAEIVVLRCKRAIN